MADAGHDASHDELPLRIEFAATELTAEQCQRLAAGAVLPFEEEASTNIRVLVANRLVALGTSMIVNGKLAVQITKLFGEEFADLSRNSNNSSRTS